MGGVGKSTLAAEYARRYRDAHYGGLWIEERARQLLQSLPIKDRPWLLVFDNVDGPESVEAYLPHHPHIHVIQTSRQTRGWPEVKAVQTYVLDFKTPDSDGVQLLMHHAKRDGVEAAVHGLAQALGGCVWR